MSFLKVSEIFLSLQGETTRCGLPTVFIRLSGCPLRCVWCDTEYAFTGGTNFKLAEILEKVKSYNIQYVTVTGGEPLAQKSTPLLLEMLCDAGFSVNLETGGMLDISGLDPRVNVTLDIKPPDSGEHTKNMWENLQALTNKDEVKFVLASRNDYEWSKEILEKYQLKGPNILLSAAIGRLEPLQLANWIIKDRLNVRFQLQLHKVLWGDEKAR